MLDSSMRNQLSGIFSGLTNEYIFDIQVSPEHESRKELLELLNDVASCSDKITVQVADGEGLGFSLLKNGEKPVLNSGAFPTDTNLLRCCWLS